MCCSSTEPSPQVPPQNGSLYGVWTAGLPLDVWRAFSVRGHSGKCLQVRFSWWLLIAWNLFDVFVLYPRLRHAFNMVPFWWAYAISITIDFLRFDFTKRLSHLRSQSYRILFRPHFYLEDDISTLFFQVLIMHLAVLDPILVVSVSLVVFFAWCRPIIWPFQNSIAYFPWPQDWFRNEKLLTASNLVK